ncbi:sterol desaturase family protein [Sodalis ligni]|uniref:sterol desaturase family protein n=1 Tax=Sodalis ligni TaxID=2697027 RepID=UPI0020968E5A|nr:sterol desaturase family protein [Sodalis ligni]
MERYARGSVDFSANFAISLPGHSICNCLHHALPSSSVAGALLWVPLWAGFLAYVIADDFVQYLWHWYCHSSPLLFNLHRLHHSAKYMGLRMAYRDNPCFQLTMPNNWFSAALLYCGLVKSYFLYVTVKMIVAVAAHSSVPWDDKLYKIKALQPIMWFLERFISTPATHAAHHGLHQEDGITHYNGNYATVFFFWDVLFGTAKITRRRPSEHGVESVGKVSWLHLTLWPIFRDKNPRSR